jgi:hypothetical protein
VTRIWWAGFSSGAMVGAGVTASAAFVALVVAAYRAYQQADD